MYIFKKNMEGSDGSADPIHGIAERQEKCMKEKRTLLNIISFLPLAGALGYIIYIIAAHKEVNWVYRVVLGGALLLLWIMRDIVVPKVTGEFEEKTGEQMNAYYKMCALEFAGYAGLAWFAMAPDQNTSIYGAVVFAGATMLKRNFRDIYFGTAKSSSDEEES